MKRLYYLTDQIEVAEAASDSIHREGITDRHFHVLSHDEAGLQMHHLHPTTPLHELDVLRLGERGLLCGIAGAVVLVVLTSQYTSWFEQFGWIGVLGVTLIAMGFGTWLGGFIGVQRENYKIRRFHDAIEAGSYLLMVDVDKSDEQRVMSVLERQTGLRRAGDDTPLVLPFDQVRTG